MQQSLYQPRQEEVVLSTRNYNIFHYDKRNRPIRPEHVDELVESIKDKNLLREFPIVVSADHIVIDGQHRLEAARFLNIPIYYIVSQNATIDDISNITATVDGWTAREYFHRWCAEGLPHYLKLKEFVERYPFLTIIQSVGLCHYGNIRGVNRDFKVGKYVVNDMDFGEKVARNLLDFRPWFQQWRDTVFVGTISNLTSNSLYDHERMMRKTRMASTWLVQCPTCDSYMALLTKIYNRQEPKAKHVVLEKVYPGAPNHRVDRKNKS